MSPSEVHAGIKRATAAGLFDETRRLPVRKNLEDDSSPRLRDPLPMIPGSGVTTVRQFQSVADYLPRRIAEAVARALQFYIACAVGADAARLDCGQRLG